MKESDLINELKKKYPSLDIIKTYPESGQKQVFLVRTVEFGMVMLKIIKKMDERIKREMDIVNSANITGVPKIIKFSSFSIENEEKYYFFEDTFR